MHGRRTGLVVLVTVLVCSLTATVSTKTAARATAVETQTRSAPTPSTGPSTTSTTVARLSESEVVSFLDRWRFFTGAPGVVVGLRLGDAPPLIVASGKNAHTGEPLASNALFAVASITKTFVGAVALQLVDEGRLALDDTIDRYIPDFPNADHITVRQLLTHTSGLPPEGGEGASDLYVEPFQRLVLANLDRHFTTDEIIAFVGDRPLLFDPGTGVAYSNVNTIVLGRVIEVVVGTDLTTVLGVRLLEPLGLAHTYYEASGDGPRPTAGLFTLSDGGAVLDTANFPGRGLLSALGAAGAMVSDTNDLLVWSDAFLRDGAFGRADLSDSRFEVTLNGLGLAVVVWAPGVGGCVFAGGCGPTATLLGVMGAGSLPGTNSAVAYFPEWDLTIVALVNSLLVDVSGALLDCLLSLAVGYPSSWYVCRTARPTVANAPAANG
jgi:D-alanyl-D-alanine carboxypeptidase